jgi:hypothetical protein
MSQGQNTEAAELIAVVSMGGPHSTIATQFDPLHCALEDAAATTSTSCSPPPAITTAFPARTSKVFAPANSARSSQPSVSKLPNGCSAAVEASITLRRACRICLLHLAREIRTIHRHSILLAEVSHRGSDIRDRIIDRLRRAVGVVGGRTSAGYTVRCPGSNSVDDHHQPLHHAHCSRLC